MLYGDAADTPLILLSKADRMVQWTPASSSCIMVDRRRQVDGLLLQKLQRIPYPHSASKYYTSQYFAMTFCHGRVANSKYQFSCNTWKVENNSIFGRIDRTPFCLIAWQICTIPRPTRTTIFIYRRYLQKKAHECNLHSDPCQGQHTKMNKFPPIKASTHNNDYTLLECIDIPEKVGVYWKSSRAGVA